MTEGLIFEVSAEDNATATLNKVQGEVRETAGAANEAGNSMSGASAKSGGLTANLMTLGKVAGVAFAAFEGAKKIKEFADISIAYSVVSGDLQQSIKNTTPGLKEQADAWDEITESVERAYDMTGTKIPELQQILVDLNIRTNSSADSWEKLNRVMGAANLTGKGAREVAKGIGEAYTGNIAPLKELGLLNDVQIKQLMLITDASERAGAAFEIADEKLVGYAEGLPAAEVANKKLEASYERLKAAMGAAFVAPISGGIATIADGTTAAAREVESFIKIWESAPRSIGAAMTESRKQLEDFTNDAAAEAARINKKTGDSQIEGIKLNAETRKMMLRESVENGSLIGWIADEQMKRIDKTAAMQIESVRLERGLFETVTLTESQKRADLLANEIAILSEKNPKVRAELKAEQEIQTLKERQFDELQNITDETTRQQLLGEHELQLQKKKLENENALASTKTASTKKAETEFERETKAIEKRHADRMYYLRIEQEAEDARIKAFIDGQNASIRATEELIAAQSKSSEIWENTKSQLGAMSEMSAEDAQIKSAGQSRRIEAVAGGLTGIGAGLETGATGFDDAAAEASQKAAEAKDEASKAHYEQLQKENEALAVQTRKYEKLATSAGSFGKQLAVIASKQWNFADASEATIAALDAVSMAGEAMASIVGDSVQEQAGIRAGFEFASAAAALGAGFMFQNPAFYAAAGQHALAGGMFAAQAMGAFGGGSTGGGGGGSAASMYSNAKSFDVSAEREATAVAFAEKLAAMNGGGGQNIILQMGTNNVFMRRSDEFGRELLETLNSAQRNFGG